MAKKHRLYCNPANGKFNWEKQYDLKNLPTKLEKYGRVVVTFEKYSPKKSLSQLGYYRGGVLPFLEKECFKITGLSQRNWHNVLKEEFGIKIVSLCGRFTDLKSHADYTEKEMSDFISKVKEWSIHTLRLDIPPPTQIQDYLE